MSEDEEVSLHLKEGDESVLFHEYTTTELALMRGLFLCFFPKKKSELFKIFVNSKECDLSQYLEPVENTIKQYLDKNGDFGEQSLEYFLKRIIPSFAATLLNRW